MISKILCASMIFGSMAVYAQTSNPVNMSDSLDKNAVPSELETRKNVEEPRNLPDRIDRNTVPAPFEERQKEEEAIGTESDSQEKMEDHSMEKMEDSSIDDSSLQEPATDVDSTQSPDSL
jgi:hypothetical protein